MVKPLKDILKEIEASGRFQFGGMAEGPEAYSGDWGGDYGGGDCGGGEYNDPYEPDPEDYSISIPEEAPHPGLVGSGRSPEADVLADLQAPGYFREGEGTPGSDEPPEFVIKEDTKFPKAGNYSGKAQQINQNLQIAKAAQADAVRNNDTDKFNFLETVITGLTGALETAVWGITAGMPFVPTVDLELSPEGRDLSGPDISLTFEHGVPTRQPQYSAEVDVAGMLPGGIGALASAFTPSIKLGRQGASVGTSPVGTVMKSKDPVQTVVDMLPFYDDIKKAGISVADTLNLTPLPEGKEQPEGGRDEQPILTAARQQTPSPLQQVAGAGEITPYSWGTTSGVRFPQGTPEDFGWWNLGEYNVNQGGLIGLNKGGNVMDETQKYGWGGLASLLKQMAPAAAGYLAGPLGGFYPALAGAGTEYIMRKAQGEPAGMTSIAKGLLLGHATGQVYKGGAAMSEFGDITQRGAVENMASPFGPPMPPSMPPSMDNWYEPSIENYQQFAPPPPPPSPTFAERHKGAGKAWGDLLSDPSKYELAAKELAWPIGLGIGSTALQEPRRRKDPEDKGPSWRAKTAEERRQLAMTSPLSYPVTFQPPNVEIDFDYETAAQGGSITGNEELKSGSFVIPADVVSDVGDGSSSHGHRQLSKMFSVGGGDDGNFARGGISGPIKGPGSGLDDLIQTSIDGVKSARISNDEFVIPSRQVRKFGDGSQKKGSERLYEFMKNVRLNKHGTSQQPKELRMKGLRGMV